MLNKSQQIIKISYPSKENQQMTEQTLLSQNTVNIESTQQALNILRNLREKRKKQNPSSIYQLVKQIYFCLKDKNSQKGLVAQTISADQYLGNNRESIEEMLIFIKDRIINNSHSFSTVIQTINPQLNCYKKDNLAQNQILQNRLAQLEATYKNQSNYIIELEKKLLLKQQEISKQILDTKNFQHQSKTMQIKLLNNLKRINIQIQQKDDQIKQLKKFIDEKTQQVNQLNILYQKQRKKMRKLQEDLYDAQTQLEQKKQQLQQQKQCADFYQKKISKALDIQSHYNHSCLRCDHQSIEQNLKELQKQQKLQVGIQTDCESSSSKTSCESDHNNKASLYQIDNEIENEEKGSLNDSVLTESKESKYIESIQRLTLELGQAYNRINQLMKQSSISDHNKAVEMFSGQNIKIQFENKKNGGKSKTRSGYFGKFWK